MNYNPSSLKNEYYRVGNIPVKVYGSKYGMKAFSCAADKQRKFPMELVWKSGIRIHEDEFIVLCSIIRSRHS